MQGKYLEIIEKLRSFDGDYTKIGEFLSVAENRNQLLSSALELISDAQNLIGFADDMKKDFSTEEMQKFNKLQGFSFEKILEMLKKETS